MLRSRLDRAFARYARTGDPGALARVFDGSAAELYRLGFHLLGDRHAAEDLVQQTFVVAIEQARTFDGERHVLPWLCGILTHRALHLRRQLRQRREANATARDDVVDPLATAAGREVTESVATAVRALPEPYRQVLLLHLVHELTPKEVAEALARPDATVRTQLARGLDLLRKALPLGIAGFAAGQVPPPLGLAAVRDAVLARAATAHAVTATAAGASAIAFTGVVAMKKVLLVVAAVIVALSSWLWWSSEPALPADFDARAKATAHVGPQQAPIAAASAAPGEATRTEAPEVVDASTAALEVLVLWHDGSPAADIPVRVRPRPLDYEGWLRVVRTGDDGVARFAGLPPGAANALTGRGANVDVDLAAGTAQRATITLEAGIDVTGRVVDLEERPIAGATVWLSVVRGSDDGEPAAVTRSDGTFMIRSAGEMFVVTATAPGFGCAKEAWVEPLARTLTLTMRPTPGVLIGTVIDPNDRPVANARVLLGGAQTRPKSGEHSRLLGRIWGQDLWPSRFLRTDEGGHFRSEGLPAIPWPVWVGAPGFAASWQEVTVRTDGPTTVTIRLTDGATIRGRVTDEREQPIVGEEVFAYPRLPTPHPLIGAGVPMGSPSPLWAKLSATTDANGCYEIRWALVAKVGIATWHRGGSARTECELREGEAFEWNPVVVAEKVNLQQLHGVLVDEDGKPLENWTIRVDRDEEPHRGNKIWVGEGGAFRTNRVPAGAHRLFAQPRDPMIGKEVCVGEFEVANCPLRVVVPRTSVPTAHVRGRILVSAGSAASRWHVYLASSGAGESVTVRVACDEQGSYTAGPLQNGEYRLSVEGSAGTVTMCRITVADGRDADAGTFRVPTPGTIVVRVVDAAGTRVPDAWVSVRPIGDDSRSGGLDHHDGVARGELPAGRWRVFSRDQTTMAAIEVDVRAGETSEIRLVVPDGVPFLLRVPAEAHELGRLSLSWRDGNGAVVRENDGYDYEAAKDARLSAPAGRYSLDVVDARGAKVTASFELRASDAPQIVELPLPPK